MEQMKKMLRIFHFDLKNYIDDKKVFFEALEIYLKEREISKKEFYAMTEIYQNSYRQASLNGFIRSDGLIKKINKKIEFGFPTAEQVEELEDLCDELYSNQYFMRDKELDESIADLKKYLEENHTYLDFIGHLFLANAEASLKYKYNDDRKNVLKFYLDKIKPYSSLLSKELELIYVALTAQLLSMDNRLDLTAIHKLESYIKQDNVICGWIYSKISAFYFNIEDYSLSLLFSKKACDSYRKYYCLEQEYREKFNMIVLYDKLGLYYDVENLAKELLNNIRITRGSKLGLYENNIIGFMVKAYIQKNEFNEALSVNNVIFNKEELNNEQTVIRGYLFYQLGMHKELEELYNMIVLDKINIFDGFYEVIKYLYIKSLPKSHKEASAQKKKYHEQAIKLKKYNFFQLIENL